MPPRIIPFNKQVWDSRKLTVLNVLDDDRRDGVAIDVHRGVVNSIFITSLMSFLAKARKERVQVVVAVADDLTYRSLEHCGVTRFATLRMGCAKYLHAPQQGSDSGAEEPTGAPAPAGENG